MNVAMTDDGTRLLASPSPACAIDLSTVGPIFADVSRSGVLV